MADAPPARADVSKFYGANEAQNAANCCNLATGAKILGEHCHAALNLGLAFGDAAGKNPSIVIKA